MRAVVQRVSRASVTVDGGLVASINTGLLVLVGITHTDTGDEISWMADKILSLRVFADDDGKLNRSVTDIGGGVILVSQFTLYGNLAKGTRPSFIDAAPGNIARPLFDMLVQRCTERADDRITIQQGAFGAMMDVSLVNDGPVTIILERNHATGT
ncbi:MAG: D-tyrosyl-tRNA(Tyr) deacylase [Candidatus Kapabacteria bacterium]|nr:D-tyrosyl-tRNA(Tyr) deacylase [Candidatus Kapabacteria bacterium]